MTYEEYDQAYPKDAFMRQHFPSREWWTPCEKCGVMPGDKHKCEIRGYHKFWSLIVDKFNGIAP